MSRKKRFKDHAEKREGRGFTPLPHVVLQSAEFAALSAFAVKALLDLLAQYRGDNNGDLCAAWTVMKARGWRSRDSLAKGLGELLERGLVVVTRQGGKHKASLYGVTFYEIDWCGGKLDIEAPTRAFMGAWHRQQAEHAPLKQHGNAQSVPRRVGQSSVNCHAGRVNSQPGALDSHGRRVSQAPSPATIDTPGVSLSRGSTPSRGSAAREPVATDPLPWESERSEATDTPAAAHPGVPCPVRGAVPAVAQPSGLETGKGAVPNSPKRKASAAKQLPAPAAEPISEEVVRERLIASVMADGSSSYRSASRLVAALISFQGVDLATLVLLECEQRRLSGQAARSALIERRDVYKARIREDLRLDRTLVAKMRAMPGASQHSSTEVEIYGIQQMREQDGRTRDEILSMFTWATQRQSTRARAATPVLLWENWSQLEATKKKEDFDARS